MRTSSPEIVDFPQEVVELVTFGFQPRTAHSCHLQQDRRPSKQQLQTGRLALERNLFLDRQMPTVAVYLPLTQVVYNSVAGQVNMTSDHTLIRQLYFTGHWHCDFHHYTWNPLRTMAFTVSPTTNLLSAASLS